MKKTIIANIYVAPKHEASLLKVKNALPEKASLNVDASDYGIRTGIVLGDEGNGVPEGSHNLSFQMMYRDKTFRDEDLNALKLIDNIMSIAHKASFIHPIDCDHDESTAQRTGCKVTP